MQSIVGERVRRNEGASVRASERFRVLRFADGSAEWRGDAVVVEEPLRVLVRRAGVTSLLGSTMRTPGQDLELGVGLAVAEGVVSQRADVLEVRHCAGDLRYSTSDVLVVLRDDIVVDEGVMGRVSHPSSACGMCGRDHIEALLNKRPAALPDVSVSPDLIAGLPDAMAQKQAVFRKTGGLHAVGLATVDGTLLAVREDVGRHNAVDKVVGAALLDGLRGDVLVVSGRVGFEIVQKAAMAGVPVVAAVSAPTSLAVDAARQAGITLIAFVRGRRMTVYSGDQRLTYEEAAGW